MSFPIIVYLAGPASPDRSAGRAMRLMETLPGRYVGIGMRLSGIRWLDAWFPIQVARWRFARPAPPPARECVILRPGERLFGEPLGGGEADRSGGS